MKGGRRKIGKALAFAILFATLAFVSIGIGCALATQIQANTTSAGNTNELNASINTTNTTLEERIAKIEGILEQMDRRLNHVEGDIRWIIGLIIATWGIIIIMWITIILEIRRR